MSGQSDFLVEYHGQGNRGSNDPRCAPLVDMDRMDECHEWYGFACKCQGGRRVAIQWNLKIAKKIAPEGLLKLHPGQFIMDTL